MLYFSYLPTECQRRLKSEPLSAFLDACPGCPSPTAYASRFISTRSRAPVLTFLFAVVNSFRALCTGELGMSPSSGVPLYYKNSIIHRVIPEFMIQGGGKYILHVDIQCLERWIPIWQSLPIERHVRASCLKWLTSISFALIRPPESTVIEWQNYAS